MTVNEFARLVTLEEGKEKSLSIAQVKEVLTLTNDLLDGELYRLVRKKKRE